MENIPYSIIDNMLSTSKSTNKDIKYIKKSFEVISDMEIKTFYNEQGELMFEQFKNIFNNYINNYIPGKLESINELKNNNELNLDEIKKLNETEYLDRESLEIIHKILNNFEYIINIRLNEVIIGTLENNVRFFIIKNNIEPRNELEKTILYNKY